MLKFPCQKIEFICTFPWKTICGKFQHFVTNNIISVEATKLHKLWAAKQKKGNKFQNVNFYNLIKIMA
jgi:hypothetical protein